MSEPRQAPAKKDTTPRQQLLPPHDECCRIARECGAVPSAASSCRHAAPADGALASGYARRLGSDALATSGCRRADARSTQLARKQGQTFLGGDFTSCCGERGPRLPPISLRLEPSRVTRQPPAKHAPTQRQAVQRNNSAISLRRAAGCRETALLRARERRSAPQKRRLVCRQSCRAARDAPATLAAPHLQRLRYNAPLMSTLQRPRQPCLGLAG